MIGSRIGASTLRESSQPCSLIPKFVGTLTARAVLPRGAVARAAQNGPVQTVLGPVSPGDTRPHVAMHEHVLVDFVGADKVSRDRYDRDEGRQMCAPPPQQGRPVPTACKRSWSAPPRWAWA